MDKLSNKELIDLCKERGIKGYSGKKKAELIILLTPTQPIKYIDLFCGLGAFHTAFHSNPAFECVFACDIDEGIQQIYEKNYGITVHGDIRTSLDLIPQFDILCAGFPCQPFSIAGNGEGFQDEEKGNLFYEILKIIDKGQPAMCMLENVKNLKTHDGGKTYQTIEQELVTRGYMVTSAILNAVDFGSPQARQRIFIVASRNQSFAIPLPTHTQPNPVNHIIDPSIHQEDIHRDKYELKEKTDRETCLAKPKILFDVVDKKTQKGGRQGERVYDPTHVGITICASSGGPGAKTGLYQISDTIRRLTVKEAVGMFGFPSTYDFSDTKNEKALFYLGNSIVVNVLQAFVPLIDKWFQRHRQENIAV